MTKQTTLQNKVTFSGIGLHSGVEVRISLIPAAVDSGIVFRRTDVHARNTIKATHDNVIDTRLGTTIANSGNTVVQTIEHLMAALWICGVDNVMVEIDNKEVPIMDGSAQPFIDEIYRAGLKDLEADRKYLIIKKNIRSEYEDNYLEISPFDGFEVDMEVDFIYGNIGVQTAKLTGLGDDLIKNISQSRTFCSEKEIDMMRTMGLARGGNLDNAMVFGNDGLINDGGFRCENEVVKHKLLDLLGDMYTAGHHIKGKIKAYKSGHTLNNNLLREIFRTKGAFVLE